MQASSISAYFEYVVIHIYQILNPNEFLKLFIKIY